MRTSATVLMAAALVAAVTLLTGIEIGANPAGVPVIQPGDLTCQTTSFEVSAITGATGEFPVISACANNPGLCADYGYRVRRIAGSSTINKTILGISADQDLDRTVPDAIVSALGAGESFTGFLARAFHEYTVRFTHPSNTTTAEVHTFIVLPSAPRITTALIRTASGALQSCRIAGPGIQANPFKPQTLTQDVQCAGGKCMCHLTFDGAGNIVSVTTDEPCQAVSTDVFVDLGPVLGVQPAQSFEQITSGTGTCTTYPTKPKSTTICR